MRTHLVMFSSVAILRMCTRDTASTANPTTAVSAPIAPPADAPGMIPEMVQAGPHGGVVASSGGVTTEVLTQPDGHLVTYFSNAQGQPIKPSAMTIALRKPDGTEQPVAVRYDPSIQGYLGLVSDVPPSAYPVDEVVRFDGMSAAMELVTPPVTVSFVASAPTPRHHGHIERFGDKIVEVVASRNGDVAMFWMDQNGEPVPPDAVGVTEVQVSMGGQQIMVPVHYEGGYFRGHVDVPVGDGYAVSLPRVTVDGQPYYGGMWRPRALVDQVQVAPMPEPYPVMGSPNYVPPSAVVARPGWNVPPGWNPHPMVVVDRPGYALPVGRPMAPQGNPYGSNPGMGYPRPGVVVPQPIGMMQQPGVMVPRPGSVIGTVQGHSIASPMPPLTPPQVPVPQPVRVGQPMISPAQPIHMPPAVQGPVPQQIYMGGSSVPPQQPFHGPGAPQPFRVSPQQQFRAPMNPQQFRVPPQQIFHPAPEPQGQPQVFHPAPEPQGQPQVFHAAPGPQGQPQVVHPPPQGQPRVFHPQQPQRQLPFIPGRGPVEIQRP